MEMTQGASQPEASPDPVADQVANQAAHEPVVGLEAPFSVLETRKHQMFPTLTPWRCSTSATRPRAISRW